METDIEIYKLKNDITLVDYITLIPYCLRKKIIMAGSYFYTEELIYKGIDRELCQAVGDYSFYMLHKNGAINHA